MLATLPAFYQNLRDQKIVLAFLGVFSQEIMVECRKILTDRQNIDKNCLLILTSVFVELTENILKYSEERELRDGKRRGVGIIVVRETDTHFIVHSGNRAKLDSAKGLVETCNNLNSMDKDGLRQLYRERRREARKADAKGAGLGLIEITRRADGPVECAMEPLNEAYGFVSLSIQISK